MLYFVVFLGALKFMKHTYCHINDVDRYRKFGSLMFGLFKLFRLSWEIFSMSYAFLEEEDPKRTDSAIFALGVGGFE